MNGLYSKIMIQAELVLETGLHIGGSSAFAAIGATDSPIIKDPITNDPIIPGSSLKGKMRSLLAKSINTTVAKSPKEDDIKIRRLFGDPIECKQSRLSFRDAFLINKEELENKGARTITEVKFENTIDRLKAIANPRQIERAIRSSRFGFELVYNVAFDSNQEEIDEDLITIANAIKLLELDSCPLEHVKHRLRACANLHGNFRH